jgi:hypothetical protein
LLPQLPSMSADYLGPVHLGVAQYLPSFHARSISTMSAAVYYTILLLRHPQTVALTKTKKSAELYMGELTSTNL